MKKHLLAIVGACLLAGAAHADEFADGVKAWEAKQFSQAYTIFSTLAAAGHPQAQQMLGEMIGFGEGVPEDNATARNWLQKALAAGNKDAAASLDTLAQRQARKPEIARYLSGAPVPALSYPCVRPEIPARTTTRQEALKVKASFTQWDQCASTFEAAYKAAMAAAIPADLANLMSLTELGQARAHVDTAYAALRQQANAEATTVIGNYSNWARTTNDYLVANGEQLKAELEMERRRIEMYNRNMREQSPTIMTVTPHK